MPFNKTKKALGFEEDDDFSAPSEDLDTEGSPIIDEKSRSYGLTRPAAPIDNSPDGQARMLKDKVKSVVGFPSMTDKINYVLGAGQTSAEQEEDAMNMASAGMGTIGKFKNTAKMLQEAQAARAAGKPTPIIRQEGGLGQKMSYFG